MLKKILVSSIIFIMGCGITLPDYDPDYDKDKPSQKKKKKKKRVVERM